MEFQLYFQMLKRGWWIILLTTLVSLAAALGISYLMIPKYQAVARFILNPGSVLITGNDVLNSIQALDRQSVTTTYAEVMNSNRVYNDALASLQLQASQVTGEYTYKVEVVANTSVLELRVTGPDANLATNLANALGNQTILFTRSLNQVYNVDFLDRAVVPDEPISPKPLLNAGLAVALGLIGGAALAILNEQLRVPIEALLHRSQVDNVTGVYNTTHFRRLVEEEIAVDSEDVFILGIVELSGLRDYLGTLPATILDRILQWVTQILRRELRGNDVIGRWNGVSFLVMLPNTSGEAATRIFKRVYQSLSQPVELGHYGTSITLDAHIGGAEYGNDISMDELFEKAVSTLDQARRDSDRPVYVWEMKNPFWAKIQ
jgi:diguanylate cyclase (GGDEF)-like protein